MPTPQKLGNISDFLDTLNENLNAILNANFRCYSCLKQVELAQKNGASETGLGWAYKKLETMANNRNDLILEVDDCFEENSKRIIKLITDAKTQLVEELKRSHGLETKVVENCFIAGQLTDPDIINYLNDNNANAEQLYMLIKKYASAVACQLINEDYREITNNYASQFDSKGFLSPSYAPTTKVLTAETVHQLAENANYILKTMQKEEANQLAKCIKLAKKFGKDPSNEELLLEYTNEQLLYEYLKTKVQDAKNFSGLAYTLSERLKEANNTGFELKDKIVQALIDFGFGTPQPKIKNKEELDEVCVGHIEFADIISVAKSFAANAELIQFMCYENKTSITMKLEDYELSKLMVRILREQHEEKLERLAKENKDKAVVATDPDVAKCLLFTTPFGTCWFNGEQLVDKKTGQLIPVSKMERIVYDQQNNTFIDFGQDPTGGKK